MFCQSPAPPENAAELIPRRTPAEERAEETVLVSLDEGLEERLRAHVDQRIDALRSEVLALLEDCRGSREATVSTKNEEPENVKPVTRDDLDNHDVHALGQSLWDCSLLIGLDCIGLSESVAVALLLLVNSFVQFYFCYIILQADMSEKPLQNAVLDELLRFRTSVAHKVEHANAGSGRSLLSQVCAGSERLHLSGQQRTLYGDLASFQNTGLLLSLLALLCWGASTLAEINETVHMAKAALQKRGECTRIVVRGGDLVLESLSPFEVTKVFLCGILPRLVTAMTLFAVGALYLGRTLRLEDLILNAMALTFVMNIDELFFAAFAPRNVKSLVQGLAPMHLTPPSGPRRAAFKRANVCFSGFSAAVLRLLVAVGAVALVWELDIKHLHGRLRQAVDILCSGQRDFVYAINPSNGMVVAARAAAPTDTWAAAECAVLQLAHPLLRGEFGWTPPSASCSKIPDMRRLEDSVSLAPVLLRPNSAQTLDSIEFRREDFDYVSALATADVQQATVNTDCVDHVDAQHGDFYLDALRDAVGVGGAVSSCADAKALCHLQNMTRVRTLCPKTCECHLWGFTAAGFFKTPQHGCPEQCHVEAVTSEERWIADGVYPLECLDLTKKKYFFPDGEATTRQSLAAMDGDEDGNISGVEASLGFMRYLIDEREWGDLHQFDLNGDGVWDASEQSSLVTVYELIGEFDGDGDGSLSAAEARSAAEAGAAWVSAAVDADGDGLLTAAEMATQSRGVAAPPAPVRITANGEFYHYVSGLMEYLHARPNLSDNLNVTVKLLADSVGMSSEQRLQVFDHVYSSGAAADWVEGNWLLAPGLPHPRGLVWCGFLASWEVVLLLGVNLCFPDGVASVRTLCPESCYCQAHMNDCPSSCPDAHLLGSTSD